MCPACSVSSPVHAVAVAVPLTVNAVVAVEVPIAVLPNTINPLLGPAVFVYPIAAAPFTSNKFDDDIAVVPMPNTPF